MSKIILICLSVLLLASCGTLKSGFSGNTSSAKPAKKTSSDEPKFLNNISVEPQASTVTYTSTRKTKTPAKASTTPNSSGIERASTLQLKYAQLLDVNVEQLSISDLLKSADEWYGTPYRYGGTTKRGVDCSAFVQAVYLSAFAFSLPRTAREQYRKAKIISATELREGDLVFFNTSGGISHVGIYLQNNKFIHASASNGVTVSDLFEPYYVRKYIGAGRIDRNGDAPEIDKLNLLKSP